MDLEKQYSPSCWSKKYSEEEIMSKHFDYVKKASEKVRKTIENELNISYGPGKNQKFDIFGTNLSHAAPILIYIHGGYWQDLSRNDTSYVAEALFKNNIKTIVLGYDLCPNVTLNTIVDEIKDACKSILILAKQLGSSGLFMSGHSAGAHLTASLFKDFFVSLPEEDNNLFKGFFLISGIYDIQPLITTYVNEPLKLTSKTAFELSPYFHDINMSNKTIVLYVGEHDSPEFKKQTMMFYEKINKLNNNIVNVTVVNNVDHFEIVELLSSENYEILQCIVDIMHKI